MTEPIGYLNSGWSFLRASEFLAENLEAGSLKLAFDGPVIVLAGHGYELLLKAYIWEKTSKQAAESFGHRLSDALSEVRRLGLCIGLDPDETDAFSIMNGYVARQPFEARYLVTGAKQRVLIEIWSNIGRKLMDAVERELAPERVANVGLRSALEPKPLGSDLPSPLAGEGSGMGGVHRAASEGST